MYKQKHPKEAKQTNDDQQEEATGDSGAPSGAQARGDTDRKEMRCGLAMAQTIDDYPPLCTCAGYTPCSLEVTPDIEMNEQVYGNTIHIPAIGTVGEQIRIL